MNSPFKFLDSYTLEDRKIFFGRDKEITDLYRRIFESKILLVYGISGTGKSSLINCGLASRFEDSDWLPLNVHRGSNIIESLNEVFNRQTIRPFKKDLTLSEKLQSIYLDNFKPLYFIFDQFEELFIFGSPEEKMAFIKIIKEVIEAETQCRLIFIIREEFLAGITEFEDDIPEIFSNRFRVEKMKRANAIQAVEGPCKVYDIESEKGFTEEIIGKLCLSGNEIELTFLQIYLDRIFRIAVAEKDGLDKIRFTKELLDKAGSVSDLLGQFLEEQIREMDDPDTSMSILKSFVSVQGTKRQMNESEIMDSIGTFGVMMTHDDLLKYLTKFVDLRILKERNDAGNFELRHDSLATKIFEKFTAIEKDIIEVRQFIENALALYVKREKLLSRDDLKYIAPYEDKLYLSKPTEVFIYKSKNEITRARKRRRTLFSVVAISLIFILSGFTIWALTEKQKSNLNYLKARAGNYDYLSQKVVETDPTIAFRLAEYALSLDQSNPDIIEKFNRIYYDYNFYRIVSRHENNILSVSFSPDGKNILTGSQDSTARLWDLNGNLLQVFKGHNGFVFSAVFSPDSKSILTGSMDNTARLWDVHGKVLKEFKGHENGISSVAFSPDGKRVLTGSYDKTARLWDLEGNLDKVYSGHEDMITSIAFSSDGQKILTGSFDKTARIWDLDGNELQKFVGHESKITSVAFSPDCKLILTGSSDKTARIWNLQGQCLQIFEGHASNIASAAFSPDGKCILTGSSDKEIRLWDLKGNTIQIFKGHKSNITSVAFSPDGKGIVTGSFDGTARLWSLQGNIIQLFIGHERGIASVAFSPDGKSVLTGSWDITARLWNLNGVELQIFKGDESGITSVSISPDGKNILTGSEDNLVRLYDHQGKILQIFKGHKDAIRSIAFSPDGKYFLTGSNDNTAKLWDLNGNELHQFEGHENPVLSVAFSPDGKSILTGSADKTARLWSLSGSILTTLTGHEGNITSVAFSPDGKALLTGATDNTARLWDLKGNVLLVLKGHEDAINSAAFSPDGKSILTGSSDKTARIWDLNGTLLQIFKGHENIIYSVAFSPDG
jgi:WD40 repeat protein